MTRQEWFACTDPEAMLEFVRGEATARKLRLFACACCRHTSSLADAEWRRMAAQRRGRAEVELMRMEADLAGKAAEVAERYADGLTGLAELNALFSAPGDAEMEGCYADGPDAAWAARASAYRARWCARYCSPTSCPSGAGHRSASEPDHRREQVAQCQLLRDIFGGPLRHVGVDPSWLTADVVQLAQVVYDERAFVRLANLGDALMQAGCTNADVLGHCRQAGEHVRGCWVVDLLLGKGEIAKPVAADAPTDRQTAGSSSP
jgi:hypothetical protein